MVFSFKKSMINPPLAKLLTPALNSSAAPSAPRSAWKSSTRSATKPTPSSSLGKNSSPLAAECSGNGLMELWSGGAVGLGDRQETTKAGFNKMLVSGQGIADAQSAHEVEIKSGRQEV